jgi:hypothetical protein
MGKGSSSSSNSTTNKTYGDTTTKNPFFTSRTDSKGNTVTKFAGNNAKMYKTLQGNLNSAMAKLNDPNALYNDPYTQSQIRQFNNQLNDQTQQNLQNQILNPLIGGNMVRSSEATNMYNNLANQNAKLLADYNDTALQQAYQRSKDLYDDYFSQYMNLYNGVNSNQNTSLNASSGNKTTSTNSKSSAK